MGVKENLKMEWIYIYIYAYLYLAMTYFHCGMMETAQHCNYPPIKIKIGNYQYACFYCYFFNCFELDFVGLFLLLCSLLQEIPLAFLVKLV